MSFFFDSHCHLDFPDFDTFRDQLLVDAARLGVVGMLLPAVAAEAWPNLLAQCRAYSQLFPALGLHPCFVDRHQHADLVELRRLLGSDSAVALGEIGLDFWPGSRSHDRQMYFFQAQLEMAGEFNLPVILHVRKAHDQVLKRLRHMALPAAGVVHAFSGSLQQAEQYLALGFSLGVGGALTYPRAQRLRKVVAAVPVESLLLETDAPDMPLSGFQGLPNSPVQIPRVYDTLVALRRESPETLKQQLWCNALNLFRLKSVDFSSLIARP